MTHRRRWTAVLASLVGATAAGAASGASLRVARRLPPGARAPWDRTNHAGAAVTLLEGPAWVGGALVGALAGALAGARAEALARAAGAAEATRVTGARTGRPTHSPAGSGSAAAVVVLAAGALGALDDLAGGTADKGLRGHLRALGRGQVTTGTLKIVGLGLTGLAGAALVDGQGRERLDSSKHSSKHSSRRSPAARAVSTLVGGAVVAGAANAVNLFDLRPGRALKVTVVAGLPMLGGGAGALAAGAAVGSSLGVVRDDLRATAMLGDTGANAAGALLGLAVVERSGLPGRVLALAGLAALTLASERVSFTQVIAEHPLLRRFDEWGREVR